MPARSNVTEGSTLVGQLMISAIFWKMLSDPQLRGLRLTVVRLFPLAKLFLSLLITSIVLALPSVAQAQDTVTGAFEGLVSDSQTGAALKGAIVEIINEQTGVAISLRSDYRGRFYQGLLIPGVYRIRVSTTGYETREVLQRLKITYTGEVVPVPMALDPASPTPGPVGVPTPTPTPLAVEDTEIRSGINSNDARRSGSFSEEELSALPLPNHSSRSFDELALLLPGVSPPPQTLGSVAGPGVGPGVASWEKQWAGTPTKFEMEGGAGQTMSEKEQVAGLNNSELTRSEPVPQTIYRLAIKPEDTVLIAVPLRFVQPKP